jgi:hypothetical protein
MINSDNSTGEDSNNSENIISSNQSTLFVNSAVNKDRRLSESEIDSNTNIQIEVMDLKKEIISIAKEFIPAIHDNTVFNIIIPNDEFVVFDDHIEEKKPKVNFKAV